MKGVPATGDMKEGRCKLINFFLVVGPGRLDRFDLCHRLSCFLPIGYRVAQACKTRPGRLPARNAPIFDLTSLAVLISAFLGISSLRFRSQTFFHS